MSPFFDELETQLRSAAHDVAGVPGAPSASSASGASGAPGAPGASPARRRRRRRRPRRLAARMDLAPVLATVLVVVLVAGAALVFLRGSRPQPTPPASPPPHSGLAALLAKTPPERLRQEFSYIAAATKGLATSRACVTEQPSRSFVHATPDRTLLSLLAVLRRPATPADRVSPSVFDYIPDVYAGSARRAFSGGGETYYLAVSGLDVTAMLPSNRCFVLQKRALAQFLPKIPPALRAQTQLLQADYIAYDSNLFKRGPRDGVCIVDTGRSEDGSSCGATAAEIKDGMPPEDDNGVEIGVVPDGVASVTLAFPASGGRAAHSVTGAVRGNLYAIRMGNPDQAPPAEPAVIWRSAHGQVLKTVPQPTRALERKACRQEPVLCAMAQDGGLYQMSSTASSGTVTGHPTPKAP